MTALLESAGGVSGGGSVQTRPDGTFSLILPSTGDYIVQARERAAAIGTIACDGLTAFLTATADVDGLVVGPMPCAVVSGRVLLPAGAGAVSLPDGFRVTSVPHRPGFFGTDPPAAIDGGFEFSMRLVPRDVTLTINPGTSNLRLKAVRHLGIDVTYTGITLRPGGRVDRVEIELTDRVQRVSGAVTGGTGGATVHLFAADRSRWFSGARWAATVTTDAAGHYESRVLPEGEYLAVALDELNSERMGDPGCYEQLTAMATPFSLRESQEIVLNLRQQRAP